MTTQQPEALRLAGMLRTESDSEVGVVKYSTAKKAEQELRRQHARIVELEAELAAAPQAVQAVVSVAHRHEFTDGHRTLKQDVFSAIHDYAATKPEQDPDDQESWESWFEAAFDLLGTRVGQIFEEHAERSAPAHPAEGAAMTHTSTEQPEALRLAVEFEECEEINAIPSINEIEKAAKELRRLHARVQELEASQAQRVPLSVVDAIKQGLQADEATRHHCRGTTNWAAAMTRFYESAHGITQEKQG